MKEEVDARVKYHMAIHGYRTDLRKNIWCLWRNALKWGYFDRCLHESYNGDVGEENNEINESESQPSELIQHLK